MHEATQHKSHAELFIGQSYRVGLAGVQRQEKFPLYFQKPGFLDCMDQQWCWLLKVRFCMEQCYGALGAAQNYLLRSCRQMMMQSATRHTCQGLY